MGMFLATVVVFVLFVVVTQSAGYYRSRWMVAGAEREVGNETRSTAAVGIVSGFIVLFLLLLLYLGFARWQWFGPPPSHPATPTISVPVAPGNQGTPPAGVNVSPSAGPSPSSAPSPSH
jgi:hypothetical protein